MTVSGGIGRILARTLVAAGLIVVPVAGARADDPPWDERLMRLAEILGALHHLRPLCGADEGQLWRDQMSALIAAEQPSPDRQKRFVERFNESYRGLAATHRVCTPAARTLIDLYTREGAALVDDVVQRFGHP